MPTCHVPKGVLTLTALPFSCRYMEGHGCVLSQSRVIPPNIQKHQNSIQKSRQYAQEQPLHKAKHSYLCMYFTFTKFYVGRAPHQQKLQNVWHGNVTMNTFTVDSWWQAVMPNVMKCCHCHSLFVFFPLSFIQEGGPHIFKWRTPPSRGPSVLSTDAVVSTPTVIAGERPTRAPLGFN